MLQPSDFNSSSQTAAYTLSELNSLIKETIEEAFPDTLWVIAELSEVRCNSKGHCYLNLIEKRDEDILAEMKGNIWAYTYRNLSRKFEEATQQSLKDGMKVLLSVNVTFHERYGLSLNIKDVDPTYSLGEMARKKRETIERLTKEGLINLNKALPLPLVPQRIAVISSATAAGYGDFVNHLKSNTYRYRIYHDLYQSMMQGSEAEGSIIGSLAEIREKIKSYDVVVIIRGGGSQVDLSCFDSYTLAAEIAQFPLPVITGIGHERDDTVVDIVAHTKMKTPTAVAGFIIDGIRTFEENLLDMERRLIQRAKELLKDETHRFRHIVQSFSHIITRRFHSEDKRLHGMVHRLISGTNQAVNIGTNHLEIRLAKLNSSLKSLFQTQDDKIKHFEQGIRLLDPGNVLKRGYSITYLNNRAVRAVSELSKGDTIQTRLYKGSITSNVEGLDEEG